jgi:hypothetical protein
VLVLIARGQVWLKPSSGPVISRTTIVTGAHANAGGWLLSILSKRENGDPGHGHVAVSLLSARC